MNHGTKPSLHRWCHRAKSRVFLPRLYFHLYSVPTQDLAIVRTSEINVSSVNLANSDILLISRNIMATSLILSSHGQLSHFPLLSHISLYTRHCDSASHWRLRSAAGSRAVPTPASSAICVPTWSNPNNNLNSKNSIVCHDNIFFQICTPF